MVDLKVSKVHAVVGSSFRLRREVLDNLPQLWQHLSPGAEIKRHRDLSGLASVLCDLDSPSLFGAPALHQFRITRQDLRAEHSQQLLPLAGQPLLAGAVVLVMEALPKNEKLGRALQKAGAYHAVDGPSAKGFRPWLLQQLNSWPQAVAMPDQVAATLVEARGHDVDAVLSALECAGLYAGDAPIDVAAVHAVTGGEAEQPLWHFTSAVLSGRRREALRLIHVGKGLDPHQAVSALASEIRHCLIAGDISDDDAARQLAGGGRWSPYHARQRGRSLGRQCLLRMMAGVMMLQRQLRTTGRDAVWDLEHLVLQLVRLVR